MATEFDTKPMKLKKDKKRALDGVSDDDAKAAKKARKAAKAAKKAAAALQSTPTNSDSGDVPDRPSTPTKNFSVDNLAALAKLKENAKEAKKKSGGSSAADDSGDGSASDAQSKWLVDNEVKIHDSAVETKVCLDFNAAPFPKTLITLLNKQGFPSPSAVQGAAWPVSMTGTDVLAIAKTGSGKTLGYLLPALTIAARNCPAGATLELLRGGASVDQKDARGWTALMHAIDTHSEIRSREAVLMYLLDAGASLDRWAEVWGPKQ